MVLSINRATLQGLSISLLIYAMGISAGLLFLFYARKIADQENKKKYFNIAMLAIYSIGLLTRLFSSIIFEGHPIDISCFKGWASLASSSLSTFYTNGSFADYPPLYIYVLFIVEKIRLLLFSSSPEWVHTLIIKMPSIVSDIVCSYILFIFAKKYHNDKRSLTISFIYLFNPVTILISSLWGQVDSLFMLLLFVAIIKLIDKRYVASSIWYALTILFKPQGLIFLPVLFFIVVKEKDIKLFIKCLIAGLITFVLPVIPFTGSQRFDWIIRLYFNTASSYKYASLNAYNFFSLIGANWRDDGQALFLFSYSVWGFIFIGIITLTTAWFIFTAKTSAISPEASTMLIAGVYVMSSRMHERYIFPAILLLLTAYIINSKRELIVLHVGLSLTAFINVLQVFYLSQNELYWVPADNLILKIISLSNVILMFLTFYVIISSSINLSKKSVSPPKSVKRGYKEKKGVHKQ